LYLPQEVEVMSNNLAIKEVRFTMEVASTIRGGGRMTESSNIETTPRIGIGQVHMLGDEGMDKPQIPQLPPELLQKIRDTLARGIAKSIVAKSINEITQEAFAVKAEAKVKIPS